MSPPLVERAGRRAYTYVCLAWGLPVVATAVAAQVAPDQRDPACVSDVFGTCETPRGAAQLLLVAAPFLVGLGLLAVLALQVLRRQWPAFRARPAWLQAVAAGVSTAVLGLCSLAVS